LNRKSERDLGKSGVLTGIGTIDVYLTVRAKEDLAAEDCRCRPRKVDSEKFFGRDWREHSGRA
jgi:hypothetical protein